MGKIFAITSIRGRLYLLLLIVFVPVFLIEAFIFYRWYESRKSEQLQANLEMARAVAKNFETFIQDLIRSELVAGLALTSSQPISDRDRNRILDGFQADHPAVRSIFWVNPEGAVIASSLRSYIGFNQSDRSFFQRVKEGQRWAVSELILGRATHTLGFTVSHGIWDEKGKLLGVVAASIDPDRLESVLGIARSAKDAGISLIDNMGWLVYRYPTLEYSWEERNWIKYYPAVGDSLKGKEVLASVTSEKTGKRRLGAYVPVSSIGWVATAGRDEDEVTRTVISTLLFQAGLLFFVTLAGLGAAVALGRPISTSIIRLRNHALAIGRGEEVDVMPVSGPEELKDLSAVLGKMADDVRSRETALQESEQRWATTLASIGDAVIATDLSGKITFMNKIAEEMTGWMLSEAASKPVTDVFHIINEHTRKRVEDPVAKVLKEGLIVGLANHTVLIRKTGGEIPIDDSGAPIQDQEGKLMGVVLVFRDITERKKAEEQITSDRYRQQLLLDHFPGVVLLLKTTTREVVASNRAGMDVGAVPGSKCFETWGQCKDPCPWCLAQDLWATGKEQHVVLEAGEKVMEAHWVPVVDDLYMHYAFDITERKRAEEKLQEKERVIQQALSVSNSFTFDWDTATDQVQRSDSCKKIFGMDYEKMCNVTSERFSRHVHPDDRLRFEKLIRNLTPAADTYNLDYRLVLDNGSVVTLEETGQAFFDAAGKAVRVIGVATDITERKRVEEQLRQAEEKSRLLIKYAPSMIYEVDFNRPAFKSVNDVMCQFLGYTREELLAMSPFDLLDDEGKALFRERIKRKLAGEAISDTVEYKSKTKDGREVYGVLNMNFTYKGGKPEGAVVVAHDITERKRMEEALEQQTLELKHLTDTLEERVKERTAELADLTSRLVSAQENERRRVSYDLHDNVWQTLEIIRHKIEHLPSQEDKTGCEEVYEKSRQIIPLIRNTVARIRSVQGDLWPYLLEDIGILATLDWYCREFMVIHSTLSIEKRVDLTEGEVPAAVKLVIYRVMQEALSNVVKHSQATYVSLCLTRSDHNVEFTVRDDGIGFDPTETLAKRSPWGGLGLLSMKQRTELSGGLFGVQSAKGQGTTVRVSWALDKNS